MSIKIKKYFLRPFSSVRILLKTDAVTKHIDNKIKKIQKGAKK